MLIFNLFILGSGIAIAINPVWAYNAMRRNKEEVPPDWPKKGRIIGIGFAAIGLVFLLINLL